jgi:hypothetical protein
MVNPMVYAASQQTSINAEESHGVETIRHALGVEKGRNGDFRRKIERITLIYKGKNLFGTKMVIALS